MAATFTFPSPVYRYQSKIDKRSDEYKKNYLEMSALVDDLQQKLKESLGQGSKSSIEKHIKSGKLLARDRVELVLDEDSPFLEVCPLAGWGQKNGSLGGSIVAGIGLVCGVECMITSSVPTIKGGSVNPVTSAKSKRIGEIVMENRLPVISMVQSGGADLTQQSEVFHAGGGFFRDLAMRSKERIPTITIVFGSSTAGGAYHPGMSDYVIMVKGQAQVFLGGPPLVKMATGEIVDAESLGGAEMHSKVSGVSDFLAENELHALQIAREIIHSLNYQKNTPLPYDHFHNVEEPYYSADELLGIVPANIRYPFDVREVIARIVDGSKFTDFKPLYGQTLVTCFARIHGVPIGILANNGVLFSDSASKGAQFIHLCNQVNLPLLFLQNITGFMVGKKYEQGGIIKHGAQLINAVSNSGVPSITINIGASYGAGNYGMNGRAYHPRFLFSWPNSKCSVMGPDQLSGVLDIVMREQFGGNITPEIEKMAEQRKAKLRKQIEVESDVYYTSARMIDDAVIDPRDTRIVIGFCLSVVYGAKVEGANHYGVSRL